ncbi:MAG: hypothetical protein A2X02_00920 [Bacteroidetes bacterium GWF2_29_10]|nr:MAG: hypothetical protein A2X02_00920 [Bacteroidetes bacterium GWF2_29_10]
MSRLFFIFILLNIFSIKLVFCQNISYYYTFNYNDSIEVYDSTGNKLDFPWTGGMNFCQFSEIDLDGDGNNDLFVFDRYGNRILTFLKKDGNLIFAPEYIHLFPELKYIALLRDYDLDGDMDIFSYGYTGISVYKNLMKQTGKLQFELKTNQLLSDYNGMLLNLFVTYADIPAIIDIDDDGDLDIVAFSVLADKLYLHKNVSIEKYGVPDSLEYIVANDFWGDICEGQDNNEIIFGSNCNNKKQLKADNQINHVGSTVTIYDFNGDGKKDLLLGDVDYPNIVLLTNETDNINAKMSKTIDYKFPNNNNPIDIYSNPACYILNVDSDSLKDLLVCASDGASMKNNNKIYYYKNTGTNNIPSYNLQSKQFLLDKTIDVGEGSFPVSYDINNDGLIDLFISNSGLHRESYLDSNSILHSVFYSTISFYKNIGTKANPAFKLITKDFANLSLHEDLINAYPAFGDIDNDGKAELIIGDLKGTIDLYKNTGTITNPNYQLIEQNWIKSSNLSSYRNLTPAFCDFNSDGVLDLIIGNKNGTFLYFKNKGTKSNPVFELQSSKFGNISTVDTDYSYFGYSVPCIIKDENKNKIFSGSYSGNIYAFNIINDINDGLVEPDTFFIANKINGYQSSIALYDFDNNGFLDMIIGNYAGGVNYYKGIKNVKQNIKKTDINNCQISLFPNPATTDIFVKSNLNSTIHYEIINLMGEIIKKGDINSSQNKINILNLQIGIYIIKLYSNETKGILFKKLIII